MGAALLATFLSLLVIAAGYALAFLPGGAPPVVDFVVAVATAAVMVALLMIGTQQPHGRRRGVLRWVFGFCFIVLAGGFSAALLSPPVDATAKLWLGLPPGAAIILYVVGIVPMLALPVAYALTFDDTTLSAEELIELRRRLQELREQAAPTRALGEETLAP